MNKIQEVTKEYLKDDLPQFRAGDRVSVDYRVIEGGKERIQKFQGDVISKKGGSVEASFTVRKISGGVGVERIFPLHSPMIAKIKVLRRGKVRRAKLNYLKKFIPFANYDSTEFFKICHHRCWHPWPEHRLPSCPRTEKKKAWRRRRCSCY